MHVHLRVRNPDAGAVQSALDGAVEVGLRLPEVARLDPRPHLQAHRVVTEARKAHAGRRRFQDAGVLLECIQDGAHGGVDVGAVVDADEDIGAAEMGRRQETMEAVESLAATRVPAIGQFVSPGQVPRDSRAYKEELPESSEWGAANANLGKAEAACKLARVGGPKQQLKKAEAALKDAKAARTKLRQKLMHRVLVRHRLAAVGCNFVSAHSF